MSHINFTDHSDLTITSKSFGLLRKALFENMGEERAKAFLMRFGRDLGISKALELQKQYSSLDDLLRLATEVHINLGHVSAVESNGTISILEDGSLKFESAYGSWFNSYEAKLHIEHYGKSEECSCPTLSGFASGYLSTIYNTDIYVKETTCQSMGYPECSFIIKSKEQWLEEEPEESILHENQTIYKELELTYDRLLTQKKTLDKMINYHSKLTDCVTHDNSIHHVLSTAFKILGIPILVKDAHQKIIASKGIAESEYESSRKLIKEKLYIDSHNETILDKMGPIYEMSTPIYLNKKLLATCSFLYTKTDNLDTNDHLFLERLASVLSLCFLKEKIKYETSERLKISILDRLIHQQYQTFDEIKSQLRYVTPDINGPYFTLIIKCSPTKQDPLPVDMYEQLLEFSRAFKLFYIDGLFSLNNNEIVVLLYNSKQYKQVSKSIKKTVDYMQKNNPTVHYKIGISTEFWEIHSFRDHLEQSKHAVLFPRNVKIINYEDLGLIGHFLNTTNVDNIKHTAYSELGNLLNKDTKSRELLYTLYIYLINGKRLEKTMEDLSLSMGGIQYRIKKIEEITKKDLKDFYTASYLLLLIELLMTLGEIEW